MSVNYNSSAMGGMPMMNGIGMMGGMGMNSGGQTGNVIHDLKMKHGCEDCFKKEPYWTEYPKPVTPLPKDAVYPSFWRRMQLIFLGG